MVVSRPRRSLSTSIKVGERKPKTTVSTKTLIRSMQQVPKNEKDASSALYYEFHFGISTFTHDSSGVLYTEIPRPLNMPLVDATSQKLERCSFEFLIANPYDSLGGSVDSHMVLLQDFANEARPVRFSNVHSSLGSKQWNIDSITFQITRVNESGQTTAITCNMSLVEYMLRDERFLSLPKFTYAIPKGVSLSKTSGTGAGAGDEGVGTTGNIIFVFSTGNGTVTATTATAHGLKSGDAVVIAMENALLPDSVDRSYPPATAVEISVNAALPTKFTYTYASAVSVSAPIAAGLATYTVTKKNAKTALYIPPAFKAVNLSDFVVKTTPQKPDEIVVTPGSTPVTLSPDIDPFDLQGSALRTKISTYLYDLKINNSSLYNKNIGDTNSESYKKAVSYLVKVSNQGANELNVSLQEIVRNIG